MSVREKCESLCKVKFWTTYIKKTVTNYFYELVNDAFSIATMQLRMVG
jgi:hypothetical protein